MYSSISKHLYKIIKGMIHSKKNHLQNFRLLLRSIQWMFGIPSQIFSTVTALDASFHMLLTIMVNRVVQGKQPRCIKIAFSSWSFANIFSYWFHNNKMATISAIGCLGRKRKYLYYIEGTMSHFMMFFFLNESLSPPPPITYQEWDAILKIEKL